MKVLVQDWQHECCGTPFSIGDPVDWLVFEGEDGEWIEEHHDGGGTRPVSGVVRRIQVVEQEFELRDDRTWYPLDGTRTYSDVDRIPDAFAGFAFGGAERTRDRQEVGVLVDLEA